MPETDPIDEVIDAAALELHDETIQRLCYDLAHRIHTNETIAKRYGFGSEEGMRRWLLAHPQVVLHARKLRALIDSDMSAEDRARQKALIATEELIAPIAILAGDKTVPAGQRIDAFKQLNRVAGVDGMPAKGSEGGGGANFTINFQFSGAPETIAATVVDATTIPDLRQETDEEENFDEEA